MDSLAIVLIPLAIGFALSPVSLLELILVLFSTRRTVNTIVFIALLLPLTAVGVLLGALGANATDDSSGSTSTGTAIVLVALGALLLLLGLQNWRNRADRSEPAVLKSVQSMGPGAVAVLVPGATLLNPKNLVLLVAAGEVISTRSSGGSAVLAGALFVLAATLPYTITAGYSLAGGATAERHLGTARTWLVAHNRLIIAIVCGLLGLVLVAKGVGALV